MTSKMFCASFCASLIACASSRKLVNVVKVRFTMKYSSRKLNNKKVITTACSCLLFLGLWPHKPLLRQVDSKKCVLNPPLLHLTNIDVTNCFFRQFFRPLYEDKGQKNSNFQLQISRILASIELKLHSMFIWFILNTFH